VTDFTDQLGNIITTSYDYLNRPLTQTLPAPETGGTTDQNITSWTACHSTTTDATGLVTETWTDLAGHPLVVIQRRGTSLVDERRTDYSYDGLGRLVRQIDPNHGETWTIY